MAPVVDLKFLGCITYAMTLFTVCEAGSWKESSPLLRLHLKTLKSVVRNCCVIVMTFNFKLTYRVNMKYYCVFGGQGVGVMPIPYDISLLSLIASRQLKQRLFYFILFSPQPFISFDFGLNLEQVLRLFYLKYPTKFSLLKPLFLYTAVCSRPIYFSHQWIKYK